MGEFFTSSMPRTALIIEDSRCTRRVAVLMLKKQGFETFEAADGQQGRDMLLQRRYSICLCDLEMPVMDGMECVRHVRQWECDHRPSWHQPIVCVSSRVDVLRTQLLDAGMDDVVQKPLTVGKLMRLRNPNISRHSQTPATIAMRLLALDLELPKTNEVATSATAASPCSPCISLSTTPVGSPSLPPVLQANLLQRVASDATDPPTDAGSVCPCPVHRSLKRSPRVLPYFVSPRKVSCSPPLEPSLWAL